MIAESLVSWLLTYALHSTLFLGLAWLVAGRLSRRAPGAAEVVWRFALVAGLVTATLSSLSPWKPVAGAWRLDAERANPLAVSTPAPNVLPAAPLPWALRELPATRLGALSGEPAGAAPVPASPLPAVPSVAGLPSWRALTLAIWGLGAALLSLGAARAYFRLGRRLRDRPRVVGGNLHAQLTELAAGADLPAVRLTCSSRVPVPLALGISRPEICVPPRALAGLSAEQQEGMLAHELAHLARRDPSWLVFTHLLTCVLFFQPLNWIARRRLRGFSELLADEWAVSRTGRPLSLAGCLAEVAGWAFGHRRLPVAAMADRPSHLARRITRLLEGGDGSRRVRRLALASGLALALVAVLGVAPVVRSAEPEGAPKGSKAREAAPSRAPEAAESGSTEGAQEAAEEDQALQDAKEESAEAAAEDREERGAREEGAACEHDHDHSRAHAAMKADALQASIHQAIEAAVHERRAGGGHGEDGQGVEEAVNDAVEEAVEGAVEGAMAGVEESMESAHDASEALDDLDGLDVDVDHDLEREIERSTAELDRLGRSGKLSEAEQAELGRRMARMAEDLQGRLRPRIEEMTRRVREQVAQSVAKSEELQRAAIELSKRSADFKPDPEAVRRLEEMARHLAADGKVSAEEAERLGQEAKRVAESVKLHAPELKELGELARKQAEATRKVMAEHRGEIERAQREMREAIDIEMKGVRQELERQRTEMRARMKEDRQHREETREKIRDEKRDERRKDHKESAPSTPPPVH